MDILQSIKDILKRVLTSRDEAYLFGSRARGTANDDSDWDILVIVDKEKLEQADYDKITYPLSLLGWEKDETISPIMYTKREWLQQHVTPFFHNVNKDAISLI